MKKLDSKLFESLKLNEQEAKNTLGGLDYTATGQDTSLKGGSSDVTFGTSDKNGQNTTIDSSTTSGKGDTTDKPLPSTGLGIY